MDPVFRSKIDLWLIAFIIAIPVLVLEFLLEGSGIDDRDADHLAIGICALILLFVTWLYFSTTYTITGAVFMDRTAPGHFQHRADAQSCVQSGPVIGPAAGPLRGQGDHGLAGGQGRLYDCHQARYQCHPAQVLAGRRSDDCSVARAAELAMFVNPGRLCNKKFSAFL